jgi:V/A-type H+/Na+-transporting ATPase subunit G/H
MEDHLKRLLEAEARAQGMIDAANAERQQALDEALAMARDAEARFAAGRAELRSPFLEEAHRRAEHVIAELARKYDERQRKLREMAAQHEAEAIDAALNLLLDPER